jgi:hypothetical protein
MEEDDERVKKRGIWRQMLAESGLGFGGVANSPSLVACIYRVPHFMFFQCPSLQIDRLTPGGETASKLSQVL